MTIVTHSGRFHPDELFAIATLLRLFPNASITRSRDEEVIRAGDFAVDVGGEYDPSRGRFDHHQPGGAGERENGIPYSSFGLVWKEYGEKVASSKEVAERVDRGLVQPIDAHDNGLDISKPLRNDVVPYVFNNVTAIFAPTWKEDGRSLDESFFEALPIFQKVLEREIVHAQDDVLGERAVEEAYRTAQDKRLVVIDSPYHWQKILSSHPEPLYIVKPTIDKRAWSVEAVRNSLASFENRKNLPASWAGERDGKLAEITGVPDAVFCHNKLFIASARSREGAIALAKLALLN